jgi:hypothetical protein
VYAVIYEFKQGKGPSLITSYFSLGALFAAAEKGLTEKQDIQFTPAVRTLGLGLRFSCLWKPFLSRCSSTHTCNVAPVWMVFVHRAKSLFLFGMSLG